MNFGITFRNNKEYGLNTVDGLDYSSIRTTAQEIFTRANQNNYVLSQTDLSKFTRVDKGLDLYNGKVDTNLAREISLQNSGKNVQLNNEALEQIQYLNAQAAQIAGQSITKNIDGKIPVNPNDTVSNAERAYAPLPNTTQFFSIDNLTKDKSSSNNPFSANAGSTGAHK